MGTSVPKRLDNIRQSNLPMTFDVVYKMKILNQTPKGKKDRDEKENTSLLENHVSF